MSLHAYESDDLFVPADADRSPVPAEIGLSAPRFFPPPTATTPEGLVCFGGRLEPEWLLDAYRHGIFPWPMWDDEPLVWWSPDPRAVIKFEGLQLSSRLRRTVRSGKFLATCNRDFEGVIRGCATAGGREGETWLTPSMIDAYCAMHKLGHAHSVEVWLPSPTALESLPSPSGSTIGRGGRGAAPQEGATLAGGVYGIASGGLFAAESMFHVVRDASKVALAHLVHHLRKRGYQLLDIQQWTPHTGRLGAIEISRLEYLNRLAAATALPVSFGNELTEMPLRNQDGAPA